MEAGRQGGGVAQQSSSRPNWSTLNPMGGGGGEMAGVAVGAERLDTMKGKVGHPCCLPHPRSEGDIGCRGGGGLAGQGPPYQEKRPAIYEG